MPYIIIALVLVLVLVQVAVPGRIRSIEEWLLQKKRDVIWLWDGVVRGGFAGQVPEGVIVG
ncbi:MAG: hypothetical protein M1827_006591 [Pycnora praestabilis]|nr:MAG: hypothetical protein M1827_006591 [Pycnora praestabilis]